MKIGIINESRFTLADPNIDSWAIHSFTISGSSLSFSEIFNSAFATPARYVEEMFARLCLLDEPDQRSPKFIFNPLFRMEKLNIELVLDALRDASSQHEMAVLSDDQGRPAGYLLPAGLASKDSRFLALLSTVDGTTDTELLQRAYFATASNVQLDRISLKWCLHNGFQYEGNRSIYRWVTDRAIKVLSLQVQADDGDEARHQRDAISFTAVMPYHAGDLLFFIIALNHLQSSVRRIVVNKSYVDIVGDNAPNLTVLPIDLPVINRGEDFLRGNLTPDHAYFERFCDQLPEDGFYGYFRPSRNYNVTKFHLIDHFIFALGRHLGSQAELLVPRKAAPTLFSPEPSDSPRKILLHFDGGWPLKIYPKDQQEQLIDLLHAKGYSVTVLAGLQYDHPKCRVTTFKSYESLVELLHSHHLLVGMDSFPVHYAVHVLGLPTICLFATTRPENSNARPAPNYLFLEKGLRCRPCAAISRCPLYGGPDCRNFVGPEMVLMEVERMLYAAVGELPAAPVAPPEIASEDHSWAAPKTKRLSLKHLRLRTIFIWPRLPPGSYFYRLYEEFAAIVKVNGLLPAMLRTLRFLRESFRR
jgi:hypothetical protein